MNIYIHIYISVMIFGFMKYKDALFLPYTYEKTLC